MKLFNTLVAIRSIVDRMDVATAVNASSLGLARHTASTGQIALEWLELCDVDVLIIDEGIVREEPSFMGSVEARFAHLHILFFSDGEGSSSEIGEEIRKLAAGEFFRLDTDSKWNLSDRIGVLLSSLQERAPVVLAPPARVPNRTEKRTPERKEIELIVLTASTGGPAALERVLSDVQMIYGGLKTPILILQHMPAEFTKNMADTMNKKLGMDIHEAIDGETITAGKILIAPGDIHMQVKEGNGGGAAIDLIGTAPVNGVRPSADVLFRSIADSFPGKQILVVVLTGMGHDGKEGVKLLKENCSCHCITQSEKSCVAYGMPGAVVNAGCSDETVELEMIGFRIGQICNESYEDLRKGDEKTDLRPLCEWIETETGISARKQMDLILSETLEEISDIQENTNVNTLLKRLSNGEENQLLQSLIEAVTIHETYWFRDRVPWAVLEEVLPEVFREFSSGERKEFRIWSAACSTGQEPYSIAMFLDQWARKRGMSRWLDRVRIIGTDISKRSLQEARQGMYSEMALARRLSEEYWNMYFEKTDGRWMIDKRIQARVEFAYGNLLKDIVKEEPFDIIFIKNVLIYFSEKAKEEVLMKLPNRLKADGLIFVGESELLETRSGQLEKIFLQGGYYFKKRR